ncbi:restriction endonuclease subunit S [Aliarcobacter butzleri]|uniref:restriction endonuclease subunit S n=1 Tax=Aliarcobacter butzleri TaxID=28197 RepID=UPI0021B313D3|nr:restriction endonuclease subunit S [Aliarcobacter butzleri]MCT7554081.1 restriction endonuclease subunit S [Aliarcobacter butzleri]
MIDNLPNGWKIEELGNMNLDISDGNYSSLYPTQNEFIEKGIPFIRANNISKNTIIDEDMRFISEDKHAILKKGQLKQNDLLFTNRGIIGQVGIVPDKYIGANINAQIVRINSGNKFTNKYLMYCFLKQELKNQMTKLETGSTLKQLPIRQLKKLNIPIPPLEQQEKIVKVLDLTSNLIEKQKELLEKYDLFLKSKFIEMFGEPILNPMGWKVVKLDSLGKWQSGGTPSRAKPDFFKGNIDWYSAGELNQLYTIGSIEKITEEAIQKSSAKIFKKNTLLIGMYDTAAFKMSILKKSSASNQAIANLDNDLKITNVLWLYFVFLAYKELYLNSRAGVRQQNLSLSKIKNFETILPPIELQNKFASIVEKIETIKEKENQKLKQMNDLHNSMMNKAFKGEIK